jgi:hypothetical protein
MIKSGSKGNHASLSEFLVLLTPRKGKGRTGMNRCELCKYGERHGQYPPTCSPQRKDWTMAAFLVISVLLGSATETGAEALGEIRRGLPERVQTWTKTGEDALYDERTIFDYINGAAEVYRAYNMQGCLSRRYETPDGQAVILDIFDMGSSEDAYGVFTNDQDGKELDLGQGAFYRSGWLSMWKDRFFISLYGEQDTEATFAAVRSLAEAVSQLIEVEGQKPGILSNLPSEGILPRSVRFFHDHMVLNRHYYLAGENILNLGASTGGVLASYKRKEGSARLLILEYPDSERAKSAHAAFLTHYIPDANVSGVALVEEDTWCAARVHGKFIAIVLECRDPDLARELLGEVGTKLP